MANGEKMLSWNIKVDKHNRNGNELAEEIRIAYITSYIKPDVVFINPCGIGQYLFDILEQTNVPVQLEQIK